MYRTHRASGQPGAASTSWISFSLSSQAAWSTATDAVGCYRRHQGLMAESWKAEMGSDGDLCEDRELRDEGRTVR